MANGDTRECVNYIIPVLGFAHMLTCGVNEGYMPKYRPIFDQVARTLDCRL